MKRSFVKKPGYVDTRTRSPQRGRISRMRMLYHGIITTKRHLMNMAGDGRLLRFSRTASRCMEERLSNAEHREGQRSWAHQTRNAMTRGYVTRRYTKGTKCGFFIKYASKKPKEKYTTNKRQPYWYKQYPNHCHSIM